MKSLISILYSNLYWTKQVYKFVIIYFAIGEFINRNKIFKLQHIK